jgi:hypothetical protein
MIDEQDVLLLLYTGAIDSVYLSVQGFDHEDAEASVELPWTPD